LAAVGSARDTYELTRWLEHDGGAQARAAQSRHVRCDRIGCRARVKGLTVAVAQRPAAFAEDCLRASIVVSSIVSPKSCTAPMAVVDFFAARREGTHAIYIGEDGSLDVETVAGTRGERPWSMGRGNRRAD
jgi:competence protein ComEC